MQMQLCCESSCVGDWVPYNRQVGSAALSLGPWSLTACWSPGLVHTEFASAARCSRLFCTELTYLHNTDCMSYAVVWRCRAGDEDLSGSEGHRKHKKKDKKHKKDKHKHKKDKRSKHDREEGDVEQQQQQQGAEADLLAAAGVLGGDPRSTRNRNETIWCVLTPCSIDKCLVAVVTLSLCS